jgi:hypothetical protein
MSPSVPHSKRGSTFLWVLGAFAGFAVLFVIVQAILGRGQYEDPRAEGRRAASKEVAEAQSALIAKMGLKDPAKRQEIFTATINEIKARKPAASTQVVPGSPTQLKQAAAAAAAAPAPAPAGAAAPAPAPAAAPAPAPAK